MGNLQFSSTISESVQYKNEGFMLEYIHACGKAIIGLCQEKAIPIMLIPGVPLEALTKQIKTCNIPVLIM